MPQEPVERKPYTLSDIAKELGLNKATVSKALSGKGNLNPQTRERILAHAQACGYRPNAVAQSLARNKTFNIGLMMPDDTEMFDLSFFRNCLQGVCNIASQNGYDVLLALDSEQSVEKITQLIDYRKVDGVIAMRALVTSPVVRVLKEKQVPFVLIGPTRDGEVTSVDNDNQRACRELTARLIAQGMKKMALLGGDENHCVTHSRQKGFLEACREEGLSPEDQRIFLNLTDQGPIAAAVDQAMASKAECIVCMDDYICNMVMIRLRSLGVHVPGDVKIVSFYDNVLLEGNIPPVTSIRFDSAELGRIACRELIRKLDGKQWEQPMTPGYRLIWRQSCPESQAPGKESSEAREMPHSNR